MKSRKWARFSISSLLILITVFAIYTRYRTVQYEIGIVTDWTNQRLAATKQEEPVPCPVDLNESAKPKLLLRHFDQLSFDQQIAAIKILVEQYPKRCRDDLRKIISVCTRAKTCVWAIRLLAAYRVADDADFLLEHIENESDKVRAAVAEGIGFVHKPSFRVSGDSNNHGLFRVPVENPIAQANNREHIYIQSDELVKTIHERHDQVVDGLDQECRPQLVKLMVDDSSQLVREAAARALLEWPPDDYQFRFAEWGVWIEDEDGGVQMLQSVIDEIPQFVHRTNDSLQSIDEKRVNKIMFITKPVVHVSVNSPMSFDVEVLIYHGRPWFAYPKPDDYYLTVDTYGQLKNRGDSWLSQLDPPLVNEFPIGEYAYPWDDFRDWFATSKNRMFGPTGGGMGANNQVESLGLLWNSIIATPEKPKHVEPPKVDSEYQWWSDLRDVPASWVQSRGETERFLYYDGPTLLKSPYAIELGENKFKLTKRNRTNMRGAILPVDKFALRRNFLFIDVTEDEVRGKAFFAQNESSEHELVVEVDELPLDRERVESTIKRFLIKQGLNANETAGLMRCWNQQFFETPGKRLLCFLSREDYDTVCPIRIRPMPTELSRAGIVLREFSNDE